MYKNIFQKLLSFMNNPKVEKQRLETEKLTASIERTKEQALVEKIIELTNQDKIKWKEIERGCYRATYKNIKLSSNHAVIPPYYFLSIEGIGMYNNIQFGKVFSEYLFRIYKAENLKREERNKLIIEKAYNQIFVDKKGKKKNDSYK